MVQKSWPKFLPYSIALNSRHLNGQSSTLTTYAIECYMPSGHNHTVNCKICIPSVPKTSTMGTHKFPDTETSKQHCWGRGQVRSDSVQSQTPKVRTADKQTAKAYGSWNDEHTPPTKTRTRGMYFIAKGSIVTHNTTLEQLIIMKNRLCP